MCRSHYLAVVSLVSCAQAAPALLSVLLYASCDYGPLWAGVAQLLAGVLMALHCSGLATRKYGTRSATHFNSFGVHFIFYVFCNSLFIL